MLDKFKYVLRHILTFFFPDRCPYCNNLVETDVIACERCIKNIPVEGVTQGVMGGYRCTSPLLYHGRFKRAVLQFKFRDKTQYSYQFAQILYKQILKSYPDMIFDYITYVPMHKEDELERGYNQSELLARDLSKLLKIPYMNTLSKVKKTDPQHSLKAKDRRTNLKGAFKVTDKSKVKGRSVLLLDDIVTTGTTLGECAKTLQKAKPAHISCVALLSVANLY